MRRLSSICAIASSILCIAVFALSIQQPQARAASTGNLRLMTLNEDTMYNYDFDANRVSSSGVDWPITMMFTGNAEVDKVKQRLVTYLRWYGDSPTGKNMLVNDGAGTSWDSDGGVKDISCPLSGQSSRHLRLYAPSNTDRFYNVRFGYYVIGSTHRDFNECPPIGTRFDGSEAVESFITNGLPYTKYPNARNFYNYEPLRAEGNHTWQNSGFASEVVIP